MFTASHHGVHGCSGARPRRGGLSLAELIAVLAVVGIVAVLLIPRIMSGSNAANRNACYCNKAEIEVQVQLWRRNHGAWPANDLSDIAQDADYFPEGLPTCPAGGGVYTIDGGTHRVTGHDHGS